MMGKVVETKQGWGRALTVAEREIPHFAVDVVFWIIGLIAFIALAVVVHMHTAPFPFELAFTKNIQGAHAVPCVAPKPKSMVQSLLFVVSDLNSPGVSVIDGAIWLVVLLLMRWFLQAVFFIVAVASGGGLFLLITPLVGRPRPSVGEGICVQTTVPYHSFPSGHVIHDVVAYGFLLYLTFCKPVCDWRYRWVLLPLQFLAILELLTIGFSRVLEGEHFLLDVIGGYILGFLWLFLFIFLYRWTTIRLQQHPIHWKKLLHRA